MRMVYKEGKIVLLLEGSQKIRGFWSFLACFEKE